MHSWGSEQHHVVLFLGIHGFDLEANRATDKTFQFGDVTGLFVQQAIHHFLIGKYSITFGLIGACLPQDLAENLVANRFRGLQFAAPLATAARLAQDLFQAFTRALARRASSAILRKSRRNTQRGTGSTAGRRRVCASV